MDLIQIFTPDLKTVFNHSTGPEAFTYAIIDELDPVMEFLNRHLSISDSDSVKWILLELTANAVAAPVCYLLGRKTGLTREEMLSVMETSALWPDLGKRNFSGSSQDSVSRMEKMLGISIPQWLSMKLKDRISLVGLSTENSWVSISLNISTADKLFEIIVQSEYPILDGDVEEIRCRFESPDEISSRVREERTAFEDEEGIYHMPSFTGGGGMGLLACIRLAEKKTSIWITFHRMVKSREYVSESATIRLDRNQPFFGYCFLPVIPSITPVSRDIITAASTAHQ